MSATKKTKRAKAAPPIEQQLPEVVEAFKGFDANLKCRDFQYEIGATYTHVGVVKACSSGFHSCEMPLDVLSYYRPNTSRFAIVDATGALSSDSKDSKIASAEITIKAEIKLPDLIRRAVAWILSRAKGNTATGDSGHAAATGNFGHAAATGYYGHAAATGNSGHAAATGDYGHAAATGNSGHAAATGDSGHAAATGYSGHAAATGSHAVAVALGNCGTAKAGLSGALVLARFDRAAGRRRIYVAYVGENGIKPNTNYRISDAGEFVEVSP